jgi:nitrite reductase/ring-hydroxylating ferredoxin subunit
VSGFVDVGSTSDFVDGQIRVVEVDGREIAVIRWQGKLHALRNVCPHQSAALCGIVTHRVVAKGPGRVAAEWSQPVIQCTRHRWEFDLASGRALCDPALRVKKYEVRARGGRVFVDA